MKKSLITLFILLSGFSIYSQNIGQLEAGYIYQFTNYMKWPDSYKSGDFIIELIGNSELKQYLNDLAKTKKVVNQKIKVEYYSNLSQVGNPHILIISKGSSGLMDEALKKVGTNSTLIISEKNGMSKKGSDVTFFVSSGRLQFNMNKETLKKHKILIDSRLEKLATNLY